MCIQKGSEHEIRSQVTFVYQMYRVVAHWHIYEWNKIEYNRESLGSHPHHIVVLVPNNDPDFQSRGLFYVKGVIIRFAEIGGIVDHHLSLLKL